MDFSRFRNRPSDPISFVCSTLFSGGHSGSCGLSLANSNSIFCSGHLPSKWTREQKTDIVYVAPIFLTYSPNDQHNANTQFNWSSIRLKCVIQGQTYSVQTFI